MILRGGSDAIVISLFTVTFLHYFALQCKPTWMQGSDGLKLQNSLKLPAHTCKIMGRGGGLKINVLDSGASGPGASPGQECCVVFLDKTLYSQGASLPQGV